MSSRSAKQPHVWTPLRRVELPGEEGYANREQLKPLVPEAFDVAAALESFLDGIPASMPIGHHDAEGAALVKTAMNAALRALRVRIREANYGLHLEQQETGLKDGVSRQIQVTVSVLDGTGLLESMRTEIAMLDAIRRASILVHGAQRRIVELEATNARAEQHYEKLERSMRGLMNDEDPNRHSTEVADILQKASQNARKTEKRTERIAKLRAAVHQTLAEVSTEDLPRLVQSVATLADALGPLETTGSATDLWLDLENELRTYRKTFSYVAHYPDLAKRLAAEEAAQALVAERQRKASKRRRLLRYGSAILAGLGVIGAGVWWVHESREREKALAELSLIGGTEQMVDLVYESQGDLELKKVKLRLLMYFDRFTSLSEGQRQALLSVDYRPALGSVATSVAPLFVELVPYQPISELVKNPQLQYRASKVYEIIYGEQVEVRLSWNQQGVAPNPLHNLVLNSNHFSQFMEGSEPSRAHEFCLSTNHLTIRLPQLGVAHAMGLNEWKTLCDALAMQTRNVLSFLTMVQGYSLVSETQTTLTIKLSEEGKAGLRYVYAAEPSALKGPHGVGEQTITIEKADLCGPHFASKQNNYRAVLTRQDGSSLEVALPPAQFMTEARCSAFHAADLGDPSGSTPPTPSPSVSTEQAEHEDNGWTTLYARFELVNFFRTRTDLLPALGLETEWLARAKTFQELEIGLIRHFAGHAMLVSIPAPEMVDIRVSPLLREGMERLYGGTPIDLMLVC